MRGFASQIVLSTLLTTPPQTAAKLLVIMGPTGCGKTKLSLDLASILFPSSSDIINSDKIQLHHSFDTTTNKLPLSERRGIPHHLLGVFPPHADMSPSLFIREASQIVSDTAYKRRTPFLVGSSNSLIYALLTKQYNPEVDPFDDSFISSSNEFYDNNIISIKPLRYGCCFINIHVERNVLDGQLRKRVDDMLQMDMLEELREYFGKYGYSERCGVGRAIGIAEIGNYLIGECGYDDAVEMIKVNTCRLAERQAWKIRRLIEYVDYEMNTVDATASFRGGSDVWDRQVLEPSLKVVERFLMK